MFQRVRLRSYGRNFMAMLLGTILAFGFLELCLRVYNPITVPLRAWEIALPVNQTFTHRLEGVQKLDSLVVNSHNSIGFRGPQIPKDFSEIATLIAVGGSTTACGGLSDEHCWTSLLYEDLRGRGLRVWVNNAGQNGHSTFGHLMLLRQVLVNVRPKYIIYFVGVNDVGRADLNQFDSKIIPDRAGGFSPLIRNSELLATVQVLWRTLKAYDLGLGINGEIDFASVPERNESSNLYRAILKEHRAKYVPAYRNRVLQLVEETRAAGIEPILMTQPALYGPVTDPTTGRDLSSIDVYGFSGSLKWDILELYNQQTREVADSESILLIDMAEKLPKDSRLYSDFIHHSIEGERQLSSILSQQLIDAAIFDDA